MIKHMVKTWIVVIIAVLIMNTHLLAREANPLIGTDYELCQIEKQYEGGLIGTLKIPESGCPYLIKPKKGPPMCLVANRDQSKMLDSLTGKLVKDTGMIYVFKGPGECTRLTVIDIRPDKGKINKIP
ncbi:MAG: hypothetical protein Q8M54_12115 [Desulfobaccales bacterium]|nr:hypothetical protein [Desulfobaccales bacterium]